MTFQITTERGRPHRLGATPEADGTHVAVVSDNGDRIELCLFDAAGTEEIARLTLPGRDGEVHYGFVPQLGPGARYGLRAHGPFDRRQGHRFDPSKLLVDPYALRLDRPFLYHPDLAAPREAARDTAPIVPRAIVTDPARDAQALPFAAPGLTYELHVRAFSQRHLDVPARLRGTLAALAEPAVLDHMAEIGVETVELMPCAAWIDEAHLTRLGLTNAWGYNPICHMALDPRLAPGGLADLRRVVAAFHARAIRVLLDVVLNHSGEGDENGPTLCYRGLDNALYYAHDERGALVNDTGCGNTFAAFRRPVAALFLDSLRTLVEVTGIDGFRYDLAPVLGRTPAGFTTGSPFLKALAADPVLKDRIHVAEAWDIGEGGYQVGAFPPPWFEWQDRFRDDVRRFWKGDSGMVGALATRLAGSADMFDTGGRRPSASVNFIAAHDGTTLADLTAYEHKHNFANGEGNRDGHDANHAWNCGVEGETEDPAILERRRRDVRALLATLFVARGTPMIVAGDEFGRTQKGNNNAYCQDNETTWLDWADADRELADFVAVLAHLRREHPALSADRFLTGDVLPGEALADVTWLKEDADQLTVADWTDPSRRFLGMSMYAPREAHAVESEHALVYLNAGEDAVAVALPAPRPAHGWRLFVQSDRPDLAPRRLAAREGLAVTARSVFILIEERD